MSFGSHAILTCQIRSMSHLWNGLLDYSRFVVDFLHDNLTGFAVSRESRCVAFEAGGTAGTGSSQACSGDCGNIAPAGPVESLVSAVVAGHRDVRDA